MDVHRSSHYVSLTAAPLTAQGRVPRARLSPGKGESFLDTSTAELPDAEHSRAKPAPPRLGWQAPS